MLSPVSGSLAFAVMVTESPTLTALSLTGNKISIIGGKFSLVGLITVSTTLFSVVAPLSSVATALSWTLPIALVVQGLVTAWPLANQFTLATVPSTSDASACSKTTSPKFTLTLFCGCKMTSVGAWFCAPSHTPLFSHTPHCPVWLGFSFWVHHLFW